jgi:hypothetical protein
MLTSKEKNDKTNINNGRRSCSHFCAPVILNSSMRNVRPISGRRSPAYELKVTTPAGPLHRQVIRLPGLRDCVGDRRFGQHLIGVDRAGVRVSFVAQEQRQLGAADDDAVHPAAQVLNGAARRSSRRDPSGLPVTTTFGVALIFSPMRKMTSDT